MRIERLEPKAWREFSADAHRIAFAEIKETEKERIDYALLIVDELKPLGYMTCRELDRDSVYWQFGGAFPGTRGTVFAYRAYVALLTYARARYKRVATLIENTNTAMLKMAMKVGFRIVGIRTFKGSVLLEHLIEFGGASAA